MFRYAPETTFSKVRMSNISGILYLVATPIGNLGDMTFRAVETLRSAALIACEDTRVSGVLLRHFGIQVPSIPYHDHNGAEQRPVIVQALAEGRSVALISDAGTPLISDPGYKLVTAAIEAGHRVVPIPGPSSVMTALMAAGLPTDQFFFAGFLPAKAQARADAIARLRGIPASVVAFETGPRLAASLAALAEGLGPRAACVARELTKLHEEFRRGTLTQLAEHYATHGAPKGEIVLVIGPPEETTIHAEDAEALLRTALETRSLKNAASDVAQLTGLPRQQLYQLALTITGKKPAE